jgi:hypothetical protein
VPGEYNLVIESFDSAFKTLTLKTDTIRIFVTKNTLAYFVTELEQKAIISGKSEEWIFPEIETNGQPLHEIRVEPDSFIASYISFDPSSNTVSYNGSRIESVTQ